ncbi:MAG: hypothetical protein H6577_09535 [Lewinellaceae bacterium]|nr:hypothetical protein [Saprospiraceae bacterium]MCB9338358.1 hypothetical protein [Lewinellaceae bacterium]
MILPKSLKILLFNLSTTFLALLFLFALLEIGARIAIPRQYYEFSPATNDWVEDDTLGWKNKPNHETQAYRFERMVHFSTNPDGLRPKEAKREKSDGIVRVMLFGNSTVASWDIPEHQTLHRCLDSLLDLSGQEYEVINAAVLGYSTDQSLLNIQRLLPIYSPDIVLYGYCINDLYLNASGYYTGLYKPRYTMDEGVLKLALPENPNTEFFSNAVAYRLKDMVQYSAFYGFLRPFIQRARIKYSRQAELDQGGINDIARYETPFAQDSLFQLLALLVNEMDKECKAQGASFLFYAHPEVLTVWPPYRKAIGKEDVEPFIIENKLREIADSYALDFVGMVSTFLENQEAGPFHSLPQDSHCNPKGYSLQAKVLSEHIINKKPATL